MSTEHLIRTVTVGLAWLGVGAAYVYTLLSGDAHGVSARLEGMLAVLTPAMLDTLRVARRDRRRSSLPPAGLHTEPGCPSNTGGDPLPPNPPRRR